MRTAAEAKDTDRPNKEETSNFKDSDVQKTQVEGEEKKNFFSFLKKDIMRTLPLQQEKQHKDNGYERIRVRETAHSKQY